MKNFTKNDNNFICRHCNADVMPLGYTSRNHCPRCLHSLHVDINPGDRANTCGGLMRPVGLDPHGKKGAVLVHQCVKCGARQRNRTADDDDGALLIKISAIPL
ncbi:MAG: RNHCP domain-containing protein [Oscillospiraceae bacterium]|nr:RNHCP domain-containing protein [Oscillospiraceae bacterium]